MKKWYWGNLAKAVYFVFMLRQWISYHQLIFPVKWPLGNVQAQKFYTDDVSLPWSGYHFWLVMLQGKFAATNKKGSDMSSV